MSSSSSIGQGLIWFAASGATVVIVGVAMVVAILVMPDGSSDQVQVADYVSQGQMYVEVDGNGVP